MTSIWAKDDGLRDVTSAFQGVTMPTSELIDDIHRRGWTVNKVHVKDDQYVAEGKNPHGEKLEALGRTDATAIANLLVKVMRREHMRSSALKAKLGAWDHRPIEQQLSQIAQAYAGAPVYEPKAAPAWMDLAQDCGRRAQTIRQQLAVEYTHDPVPYESADDLREDVTKKRHVTISRAYPHHPVWSEQQVLDYRLMVDVLGHTVGGGDWGWHGTCLAFASLAPLLADQGQKALFTELLGQTAFGTFYRQWGPQKICFLEDLVAKQQEKENAPGHTGVHPSQSIVPGALPSIFTKTAGTPSDPNADWESGVSPLPDNAYLWQRADGVDPLNVQSVTDNLYPLAPGISRMHPAMAKQAVVNSLRQSLLGTRSNAAGHAVHYHDVMGIPANVDDPMAYHDALEQARDRWNQGQGYAPGSHKQYWPEEQQFKQWVKSTNPKLDDGEVQRAAKRELLHMLSEEEERVLAQDQGEQLPAEVVEHEAYEALRKRLKALTKPNVDQKVDFGDHYLYHEAATEPSPYDTVLHEYETLRPPGGWSCDNGAAVLSDMLGQRNIPHELVCGKYWHPDTAARQRTMGGAPDDNEFLDEHHHWVESGGNLIDPNGELRGQPRIQPTSQAQSYEPMTDPDFLSYSPLWDPEQERLLTLHEAPWLHNDDGVREYLGRTSARKRATYHADMYPPYLTSRMRPLAQISRHADELAEAAREDLASHKGHGHHFRATALSLGIPQLGPRQISNAWLHLAPQTSQLGVIDPQIMETLGHDYLTDSSNRNYFKHERELAAGRDAAGYGHVPLGPFSAGLWDLKAGGPGWHPDRTPFKAHAPAPHEGVDWNAQTPTLPAWTDPYWWASTQQARDQAGQDFDRNVAVDHSRDAVPFQRMAANEPQLQFHDEVDPYTTALERPGVNVAGYWGRWPTIYDGFTVHVGPEGSTHDQLGQQEGVAGGLAQTEGWIGHNPEFDSGSAPTERQIGSTNVGWYNGSPGSHIDYALATRQWPRHPDSNAEDEGGYGHAHRLTAVPVPPSSSPWVTDPRTGERVSGLPGTSLMQHVKQTFGHPDVHTVWDQDYEVGKGSAGTMAKVTASNLTFSRTAVPEGHGADDYEPDDGNAYRITALRGTEPMGYLDYNHTPDNPRVRWVEAHEPSQGVGTALLNELQRLHPHEQITTGGFTPEGEALWNAWFSQ